MPDTPHLNYRVIGYLSASFGLAVACRNTITALQASGRPVGLVDVDPGLGRKGSDTSLGSFEATCAPGLETIDLFHVNPKEIVALQDDWLPVADLGRDARVCVPFWEMPHLPADWVPILETMDVVLAPTRFIEDACRAVLSRPVIHYPQAVFLPEGVEADRARWGIGDDTVVFVSVFDPASGVERKNPWGAVRAFARAFGTSRDARLLIHANRCADDRTSHPRIDELDAELARHPNVTLLRERLDYRDVLSLYASCDVFVSLHRAEGLGLPLMEAMSLGRVAMATGWSGNLDFMDDTNSVLIDSTPVRIHSPEYSAESLRVEQVWADADLDQAAGLMRRLAEDPALRSRLGDKAKTDMEARRRTLLSGAAFDTLETALDAERAGRSRRGADLARMLRRARFRRGVGRTLRRYRRR